MTFSRWSMTRFPPCTGWFDLVAVGEHGREPGGDLGHGLNMRLGAAGRERLSAKENKPTPPWGIGPSSGSLRDTANERAIEKSRARFGARGSADWSNACAPRGPDTIVVAW